MKMLLLNFALLIFNFKLDASILIDKNCYMFILKSL